jgi:hypothetical protein
MKWVNVEGERNKPESIEPVKDLTQVADGKEITLLFDQLKAGEEVMLTFTIKDAETKEPIRDLQQQLDMW